jgi:hypothetical protein
VDRVRSLQPKRLFSRDDPPGRPCLGPEYPGAYGRCFKELPPRASIDGCAMGGMVEPCRHGDLFSS